MFTLTIVQVSVVSQCLRTDCVMWISMPVSVLVGMGPNAPALVVRLVLGVILHTIIEI